MIMGRKEESVFLLGISNRFYLYKIEFFAINSKGFLIIQTQANKIKSRQKYITLLYYVIL